MYKNPSKIIQNLRIMDLKILYKMIKVSILLKSTTLMIKNSSFNPKTCFFFNCFYGFFYLRKIYIYIIYKNKYEGKGKNKKSDNQSYYPQTPHSSDPVAF